MCVNLYEPLDEWRFFILVDHREFGKNITKLSQSGIKRSHFLPKNSWKFIYIQSYLVSSLTLHVLIVFIFMEEGSDFPPGPMEVRNALIFNLGHGVK